MKKCYREKIFFLQNDSYENLDNLSYLFFFTGKGSHGPINSYHSFWWNFLTLCLHDADPLDICMKKYYYEKILFFFYKMTAMRT